MVTQANLLFNQFQQSNKTQYILIPNQHIGAWKTMFMPQWLVREYLSRRGHANFDKTQVTPSRSPLLGYSLNKMKIEGVRIPKTFLQPELQPEIGEEAYDKGAAQLFNFFKSELEKFIQPELNADAKKIIEACLSGCDVSEYEKYMK